MGFEVSEDILRKTTGCSCEFSCLSGGGECFCELDSGLGDKVIFIKPRNGGYCNYMISFGHSFVCTCPTRKEIFNRYSI